MFGKKAKKQQAAQAENAKNAAELNKHTVTSAIPVAPVTPANPVFVQPMPEQKVFYESEVINEADEEEVVEIELLLDPATLKAQAQAAKAQKETENNQEPDVQTVEPVEVVEVEEVKDKVEEVKDSTEVKDKEEKEPVRQYEPQAPTSHIINITNTVVNPYAPTEEKKEEKKEEEKAAEPEVRYVYDGPEEDDEVVKPAKLVKLPNLVDYMLSLKMSKRMKMNVATLLLGAYAKFKSIPAEKEILIGCMKKIMYALMNEQ